MKLVDIIDILSALSKVRKLFWSEDDFKFEFATMIKVKFGDKVDIRLEKRYERDKKSSYTDIVVKMSDKTYPIELKYKTTLGDFCDYDDEVIKLLDHSAVDLGCYGYLKDIERLEYLSLNDKTFERGFAIILTNEPKYFNDTKRESVYNDFKIYQGNTLHGSLDWKRENYVDRQLPAWIDAHPPILLNGTYAMNWLSYSNIGFKYQVAEINKAQSQSKSAAR